jgi:hypothetical protein
VASQGPNSPSTGADVSGVGTVAWTNAANVTADDGAVALTGNLNGTQSHYLVPSGFGFSIPAGSTILGVLVEIKRRMFSGGGTIVDGSVRLTKDGTTPVGTDKKDIVTFYPGIDTYASYGGSADDWAASLTDTDVNGSTFGCMLSANETDGVGNCVAAVTYARITVTYGGVPADSTERGGSTGDFDQILIPGGFF